MNPDIKEGFTLFTPFVGKERLRAYMMISEDDVKKFDALPLDSDDPIDVFDTVSQAMYRVSRAACGHGCRCGARVIGQVSENFVVTDEMIRNSL